MQHILLILTVSLFFSGKNTDPTGLYIENLLSKMTLAEKIGQLNQQTGSEVLTGDITQQIDLIKEVKAGRIGSVLNITGTTSTRELQKIAVEQSRLGIPLIFALDVIHGYKTIFPIPLAEACSWDTAAVRKSAEIAAREATSAGIQWTFAPMVDLTRDPRWGRVMEGSGEDALLGSRMAIARIKGFQGKSLSDTNTLLACAKHFVGYGAAEGGRDYNTVDFSQRRLYEYYLQPFYAAQQAGTATFMNSFNELDGIPATGNSDLVNRILRSEWKFEGAVVSDWNSIGEMISHGVARNKQEAARLAIHAGCDIDMESHIYISELEKLVHTKAVSENQIDDAVRRVLKLKYQLGLFEDPYKYFNSEREANTLASPDHVKAARQMAQRSIVLLKNEGEILPLKKSGIIGLIGPLADSPYDMLGGWSAKGEANQCVSILEGLRQNAPKAKILYTQGCSIDGNSKQGFPEALRIAKQANIVVLCLGEGRDMSGEAYSRSQLTLPGIQQELLKEIHRTGKPIVLVLSNGRPLTLSWEAEHIPAIVETWLLGSQAGNAIADILFGTYNPSGKLAMSFPYNEGQIPVYYNHKNTGRPWQKGTRYTTRYIDIPNEPLFPFGYGLSYTTFEYSDFQVTPTQNRVRINVKVKNTGKYAGEETIQLYVRDPVAQVTRPVKELKDFRKIFLSPGEQREICFELRHSQLEYLNKDLKPIFEAGEFIFFIGGNPNHLLSQKVNIQ